jgi:hypothetical protein
LDSNGKPIPRATITASGKESVPAVTDSFGAYTIDLFMLLGDPVSFHIEKSSYVPLDRTVAVAFGLATDFTLLAKAVNPKRALNALHSVLKTVDITYPEIDCSDPPCPGPYRSFPYGLRTKTDPNGEIDAIDFVSQDSQGHTDGSVFETISIQNISRLSDEQKAEIVVYEEGVSVDYAIWSSLSSQLQSGTPSTPEKASIATRLVKTGKDMCGNFVNMLGTLKDVNIDVWDHYSRIKFVCERFTQSHMGG